MRVERLILCGLVTCGGMQAAGTSANVDGSVQGDAGSMSLGADTSNSPPDAQLDDASWAPVRSACVSAGPGQIAMPKACPGFEQLVLSDPSVRDLEGGPVTPGTSAVLHLLLTNPSSIALSYPCVGFAADNPGVSFGPNPGFSRYAILPGATIGFSICVTFSVNIAPGTVVRFAAWTDEASSNCTNGALLEWNVTLGGGADGGSATDAGLGVLSATAGRSFVYWENRAWPQSAMAALPLPESSYQPIAQTPLYTAAFSTDGMSLVLTSVTSGGPSYKGTLGASAEKEARWDLNAFAGGAFRVWGGGAAAPMNAEVTILGSGVPVISSNRGILLPPAPH